MQLKQLGLVVAGMLAMAGAQAQVTWQTSTPQSWQTPTLNDSTAALLFIRADQDLGHDSNTNIAVNNRYLTSLSDGHYVSDVVCAGSVQISATPTKALTNSLSANSIHVTLMPKQVQYIYVEVDDEYRPSLRTINASDARGLIASGYRQSHQISRTNAENCPEFYSTSDEPITALVTQTAPVIASIGKTTSTNTEATETPKQEKEIPAMRLNIHFGHNKSVIKPGYQSEIARAAKFLANYPDMDAMVEGHTDSTGNDAYNQALSQRRAEAVRQALIKGHNISPDRLKAKGYGESSPIADNKTAEGRAQNRRVVIRVPASSELSN